MIKFKQIRYKNILSTGNAFTSIDLDSHDTTLIVGENGAGKSTLLDALFFCLYGKPFRKINKPQLVNSINKKNMLVEIDFVTNNKEYTIRRGIKPGIFEVWEDGVMLHQDGLNKHYQKDLEENILKMNYKTAGQIVVLGSSTFVPFMQLPAAHRREIIEDLLDLQVFTKMNILLKEDLQQNKEEISDVKYQIQLQKQKIDLDEEHQKTISAMKTADKQRMQERIDELEQSNSKIEKTIEQLNKEIEEKKAEIKDENKVQKKLQELFRYERSMKDNLERYKQSIEFYNDNDVCPACKQGIEHDHKVVVVDDLQVKVDELQDGINKIEQTISCKSERLQDIKNIQKEINDLILKVGTHTATHTVNNNSIKSIVKDINKIESDLESITSFSDSVEMKNVLRDLNAKQKDLIEKREHLNDIGIMLKDGGIKTQIIRQYVPIMNKLINKYLADMDFFVQFELDEQFNETIRSRFRDDFSYESFSEGEKMRIDLSLLFTWRAISRMRNSVATNLLIMDEVFDGSLDGGGIEEFLNIMADAAGNSNIFVISHKTDQLIDKFSNVLFFKKEHNFSTLGGQ